MARTLVVYYSRTGQTRRVAEVLARALDAELEALTDAHERGGVLGYFSALKAGALGESTELRGELRDPSAFDLVIVGTPLWSGRVSAAVRSYLTTSWSRLPEVAFFVTCSTADCTRAFEELARLADRDPQATLRITEAELQSGAFRGAALGFAEPLGRQLSAPVRQAPATPSDAAPPPGM